MTRFVDALRSAPTASLESFARAVKWLALRNSEFRDTELEAEYSGTTGPLAEIPDYQRMTHFYLSGTVADLIETIPSDIRLRSHSAFRPLTACYSFEISGWLTAFVFAVGSTSSVVVCGEGGGGVPIWVCRFVSSHTDFSGEIKAYWNERASPHDIADTREAAPSHILSVLCGAHVVMTIPGLLRQSCSIPSPKLQRARRKRRVPELVGGCYRGH